MDKRFFTYGEHREYEYLMQQIPCFDRREKPLCRDCGKWDDKYKVCLVNRCWFVEKPPIPQG